jgi:D-arabinose 1-dehydrogenase-like Zn-dependent alcohol dehydrogenase
MPISALDMIRIEPSIRGIRGSRLNDQRIILELLETDRIKPKIHSVLPLSQIAQAHQLLESGTVEGRIVLDPFA